MANFDEEFDYGEVVKEALENKEWRFQARKVDDKTIFAVPMSAKNCPGLNIRVEISESGDSKIRCYIAEDTPKSVRVQLLDAINFLNGRYRYVTLSLDEDGDILAAYDFIMVGTDKKAVDKQAGTMILLLSDIIDKCIPPIMKIIWSAEDDDEDEE